MLHPTTASKLKDFVENQLITPLNAYFDSLVAGDLIGVEQQIEAVLRSIHNRVLQELLPLAAEEISNRYVAPKGSKMIKSPHKIYTSTGDEVSVSSFYLKQMPSGHSGSRRPLVDHWKIIGCSSPSLYDQTAYMSMLAPSFNLGNQALNKFGVDQCSASTRKTTLAFASQCRERGQENLILEKDFTLKGKRVVISTDGGRTRMRLSKEQFTPQGYEKYHTPWREPKLFVIDILDKDGRPDRCELPIYGCRFSKEDVIELLGRYLARMGIDQAIHVQLIADGAEWIWNEVPQLIIGLGVKKERLTQTIDYFHSLEYAYKLIESMPKRVGKKERSRLTSQIKNLIKQGEVGQLINLFNEVFKRPKAIVKRWINYFVKHEKRMQYAHYQAQGLMRGSGIIESAVRRIINLRFKNAATFWRPGNVENLYFLRGALLSGRWDIVMANFTKSRP